MNAPTTYPSPLVRAYLKYHSGMMGELELTGHPSDYEGELPGELAPMYYYSQARGHCVLALSPSDRERFDDVASSGRLHELLLVCPIASVRRGYELAHGCPVADVLRYSDATGYPKTHLDTDVEF